MSDKLIFDQIRAQLAFRHVKHDAILRERLATDWHLVDIPENVDDLRQLVWSDDFMARYGVVLRTVKLSEPLLEEMWKACVPNRDHSVHMELTGLVMKALGARRVVMRLLDEMQAEDVDALITAAGKAHIVLGSLPEQREYEAVMSDPEAYVDEEVAALEQRGIVGCMQVRRKDWLSALIVGMRRLIRPYGCSAEHASCGSVTSPRPAEAYFRRRMEIIRGFTKEDIVLFERLRRELQTCKMDVIRRMFCDLAQTSSVDGMRNSLERRDLVWLVAVGTFSNAEQERFARIAVSHEHDLGTAAMHALCDMGLIGDAHL